MSIIHVRQWERIFLIGWVYYSFKANLSYAKILVQYLRTETRNSANVRFIVEEGFELLASFFASFFAVRLMRLLETILRRHFSNCGLGGISIETSTSISNNQRRQGGEVCDYLPERSSLSSSYMAKSNFLFLGIRSALILGG